MCKKVKPWSTIRALTIHQPYASEILSGLKRFEQRTWTTRYRGLLAIHAGGSHDTLPVGGFVGLVVLAAVHEPGIITHDGVRAVRLGNYCWEFREAQLIEFVAARGRQGLWRPAPLLAKMLISRRGSAARVLAEV